MNRYLFFLLSSIFLLLAACSRQPETLPTIRIGHAPHDHHAALYVAAQLPEYFQQHGDLYLQEVKFKEEYRLVEQGRPIAKILVQSSTGGGQLVRKLEEQQLDLVLGGVPAMLKQIDGGSSMRLIAPLMSEGAGLVLGRGFEVNGWAGFVELTRQSERPLRIGYRTKTSVQNLIFEQALISEGISYSKEDAQEGSEVVLLNLHAAKNLIPAMQNGLIDGFVVMQPYVALAEYEQVGETVAQLRELPPARKWAGHPCCALAASGAMLESESELLSRIAALLLRANNYLEEQPDKAAELVSKWLGKPVEVERRSLPTINYLHEFSADWHRGVDFWIETMQQRGSFKGVLGPDFRREPLSHTIYHQPTYQSAQNLLDNQ